MKNVLMVVTPDGNQGYIDHFLKLVSTKTPRLSISELGQRCCSGSIIGQVLDQCFEYEKVLSLKKFEKVEGNASRYGAEEPCLIVSGINENQCLGIGYNSNVEFFRQTMGKKQEEYFPPKQNMWIKPSLDFLQTTHGLLPVSLQAEFKDIFEGDKQ
jgi:hypothetical protein